MSQVLDLYRLQKVDTRLEQIMNRVDEIRRILSSDQAILQAQKQFDDASVMLENARKDLRNIEGSVHDQQIKIEENNHSLYSGKIHNPKELQDIQHEIVALNKYLHTLEDQQIEAMILVEQAEAQLSTQKQNLADTHSQVEKSHASLFEDQQKLTKEETHLHSERQSIAVAIPAELLTLYDKLKNQKKGVAVTSASDSSCDSCGAPLTPAEWQTARSTTKIIYCPSCGRILFPM